MTWKALVPPAALPLLVSIAVALGGPGGVFESRSPQQTPTTVVGDVHPTDDARTPGPILTPIGSSPAPLNPTRHPWYKYLQYPLLP